MLKVPIPKHYVHGRDPRSKETVEKEGALIRNLCSLNELLFKPLVDTESKREIQMFKNTNLEMKLSGGRYLTYTDRTSYINESDKMNPNLPVIMTVHGIPGTLFDFLNIQQNLQSRFSCRWINFSTPGLDCKDERRGTYKGYLEDVALLMKDFLDKLNIDKVILVMHSAGGMYGKNFAFTFPHKIKATVQFASIGLEMWHPILFQNILFERFGINVLKITKEEVESEDFRQQFTQQINEFVKSLESSKDKNQQVWKSLTVYHHIMLLKAQLYQGGFDQFFFNIKNIDRNIPRFFAYSSVDTLLEEKHLQQEVHHCILSKQANRFILKEESNFDDIFLLRDKDHVLKNFIFSYNDAGHAFQHHKGFDISIKLITFIQLLDHIQPVKQDVEQLTPAL